MSGIPGGIEPDQQPPLTVPLRHFFVALGFLLAGVGVGIGQAIGTVPGLGRLAHVHLLLAGWVCTTIMGAMTQFVPVWSGTTLHSRRLANVQLSLVTAGLAGFALALLVDAVAVLFAFGVVLLAGFWVFVYNLSRTLATVETYDTTEQHFLFALLCFLLLTTLGVVLAVDLSVPVLSSIPASHGSVLGAHVTLAVFGAILTTIYGALYQLGTMFTQTELHGVDTTLQRLETVAHPAGVIVLAAGRLADAVLVARVGAVLVIVAALAFAAVLGRKLFEMNVEWTPMHSRYWVVVIGLAAWAVLTVPGWMADPTARRHLFGGPEAGHVLALWVVGFVVFGTLYHIVPFIVWVHQYSDRLGLEDVPMVDELYSDRLARTDFALLLPGSGLLVVADAIEPATWLAGVGGLLVLFGTVAFTANMLLVVRTHSPSSLDGILLGSLTSPPSGTDAEQASGNRNP